MGSAQSKNTVRESVQLKDTVTESVQSKDTVTESVQSKDTVTESVQSKNEVESMKRDLTDALAELKAAMKTKERGSCYFHVLFIGASGAGKTSLLNLFGQLGSINEDGIDKIKTDFKLYNDVDLERAPKDRMSSKTSSTRSYDIKIGDIIFKITDTPGLGVDSDGIYKSREHVRDIVEHLPKVAYLDCICLVINGRTPRDIPEMQYALSEISALLPKIANNNMVICITNCEDVNLMTFDVTKFNDFFKCEVEKCKIFCIENPVCRLQNLREHKRPIKGIEECYALAHKEFCRMLRAIKDFHSFPTTCFLEVYKAKEEVEREILAITVHQHNQTQLGGLQTGKVKVTIVRMSNDPHYNTICNYPECYSVCHSQCRLPLSFGTEIFRNCLCMNESRTVCTVCKHPYTTHYHQFVKFDREELFMEYNQIDYLIRKNTDVALLNLSNKINKFNELSDTKDYIQVLKTQSEVIGLYKKRFGSTAELSKAQDHIVKALQIASLANSAVCNGV